MTDKKKSKDDISNLDRPSKDDENLAIDEEGSKNIRGIETIDVPDHDVARGRKPPAKKG